MSKFEIFMKDALEKYDKNTEIYYNDIFKNAYYEEFIFKNSEIDYNEVIFYDKDKNIIGRANYEMLGNFYVDTQVWVWAWSDPSYNKKVVTRSTNLLFYGLKLDATENFSLKMELVNSRFQITDPIQIDIHLAIASELCKTPCLFKYPIVTSQKMIDEEITEYNRKLRILRPKDIQDEANVIYKYLFIFNMKKEKQ